MSIGKPQPPRIPTRSSVSDADDERELDALAPNGRVPNSSTLPAPEGMRLRTVSLEPGPPDHELDEDAMPTMRPPERVDVDPYLGCVIDGRYLVESTLGEGGMGVVYTCKHKLIGKRVAMKVLRADMARDPEVTSRFLNEARAASAIGSPHIIDISDFGRLPDGSTYFVMEYLDGQPLTKIIDPVAPVPVTRMIHIARQLAGGLAAAHHANIVHRDLKPDNIFLVQHGAERDFVKILDFGIAKVSSSDSRLTRAGQVFGTPHYMSPEQAAGSAVDHRGDIYALGVILYEMASGKVPFDADNFLGILTQHMYKAPAAIRKNVPAAAHIPAGLEAIILKCLSKRQDQRYQSMDEVISDFDRLQAGEIPEAVSDIESRTEEFAVPGDYFNVSAPAQTAAGNLFAPRRRNWPLYAGVAALLAAVAIVAAIVAQGRSDTDEALVEASAAPLDSGLAPSGLAPTGPAQASVPSSGAAPGAKASRQVLGLGPAGAATTETTVRQVVLATEPIDAQVFLGGKGIGSSPVLVDVVEGQEAKLEIRRAGYRTKEVTVNGSEGRLSVRLDRAVAAGRAPAPAPKPKGHVATDLGDPWAPKR